MNSTVMVSHLPVMAFRHDNGIPSTFQLAKKYAGPDGRLANLLDIARVRINANLGSYAWSKRFTTVSSEYYGYSKQGNKILIVAHGKSPLSTLDGIYKAYRWEYKDKSNRRKGGRISSKEFLDLESGKFGDVSILDMDHYHKFYEDPYKNILRLSEALKDQLVKARLGSIAEEYLFSCARIAIEYWCYDRLSREDLQALRKSFSYIPGKPFVPAELPMLGVDYTDPYIFELGGDWNTGYKWAGEPLEIEEGMAHARLLSVGYPMNTSYGKGVSGYSHAVEPLDWDCFGATFVSIPPGAGLSNGIMQPKEEEELLYRYWEYLRVPADNVGTLCVYPLMNIGNQFFTQYIKRGETKDILEPEYVVTGLTKVGEVTEFRTRTGSGGEFKYSINEIKKITPPGANAYMLIGDHEEVDYGDQPYEYCLIQFFNAKVDTTSRIMRKEQLKFKHEKFIELVKKALTATN